MFKPAAAPEEYSFSEVDGIEFRKWAEFGTQEYGRTPWFFLRELAQNARDAGARSIEVDAGRDGEGREYLVFSDDGSGMTWDEARRFLFRLYSSSKDSDVEAAGKYGIGFWTVLHFDPEEIRVVSRRGREAWGITFDRDLRSRPLAATIGTSGTRITLLRRAVVPDAAAYAAEVRRELEHHCGFLRGRRRQPLPLYFHGAAVNREIDLPGPVWARVRDGPAVAVAGFADRPEVRLYARGLFIWSGRYIEEIGAGGEASSSTLADGIYPVLLLDSDRLHGTIFRREALAGRELQRLLSCGEKALRQLFIGQVRVAYPRPWWRRLGDFLIRERRLLLGAVVLVLAALLILSRLPPFIALPGGGRSAPPIPETVVLGEAERAPLAPLAMRIRYSPPRDFYFRFFAAERYTSARGFSVEADGEDPPPVAGGPEVAISLTGIRSSLYLPLPTGYIVLPGSLDPPVPEGGIHLRMGGETAFFTIADPPGGTASIRYRCVLVPDSPLSGGQCLRLTELPEILSDLLREEFPEWLSIRESGETEAALAAITRSLREGWFYDGVPSDSQLIGGENGWYERMAQVRRGDCDVLNGVAVIYFRYFGIPARLAVGVTGRNGIGSDILHSWVEYHDGAWRVFDATVFVPAPPAGTAQGRSGRLFPFALAGALVLVPIALLLIRRRRLRPGKSASGRSNPVQARRLLGKFAEQMISRPELWKGNPILRDIPFIPVIRGPLLTLRQAVRLARRSKLYKGRWENPLARFLARRGCTVLDTAAADFSSFLRLFPKVRDLDGIHALGCRRPQSTATAPEEQMLASVNHRVERIGSEFPPFLIAPRAPADFFQLITLPHSRMNRSAPLPKRFFAVAAGQERLNILARKWVGEAEAAEFSWIGETLVRYPLAGLDPSDFLGRFAGDLVMEERR